MTALKKIISKLIPFLTLSIFLFLIYWVVSKVWNFLHSVDEKLAIAMVTAATTVIVSTLTVVIGRYYERKKDIEAHFREKKIEIYDDFLREFFNIMENPEGQDDLVSFLREWQRKMILWGGQEVLKKYVEWMGKLKSGEPDAKTMWLTEDFFRAIRKDLGHSSSQLPKGTFTHLILRNADLFIKMSKENPNITLAQLAEVEKNIVENR